MEICIILAGRGAARWEGVSKWPGKVSEGLGDKHYTSDKKSDPKALPFPSWYPVRPEDWIRAAPPPPPAPSGWEAPALTPDPSVGDSREPVTSESYCFSSVLLGNGTLSGIFSFHKLLGSVCDQRVT